MELEDLRIGAHVKGVIPNQAVTVVQVEPIGTEAITLTYRDSAGAVQDRMVFRSEAADFELVEEGRPWSFDGDGADFRLAAEAYRIHLAHLFDPLMAVHTSNVEPLPHQITAVYESLLPRQPLRYLLADDPGAGKTIMAGLYIRELMVRADLRRCLIIAPGSLVEQWQDELDEKFGVLFTIFTRDLLDASRSGNPFDEHDLIICRLDQLSRNDELREKLQRAEWDLVVVDEAHKMSASYWGGEIKKTKRYELGEMVGKTARHLLLMTATPHNGKEEDFQLFMALLDSDRFYGKFRDGVHQVDTSDLMRRMVKEDLLKFDGTRLFPERRAYTVNYQLSDEEAALYEAVTQYVREEMNRADQLETGRKGTVGFALTILQRRLASSPEAIYQSLKRRRDRLERRLEEEKLRKRGQEALSELGDIPTMTAEDVEDFLDEAPDQEIEEMEEKVVDQATAALTIAELEAEIESLKKLVEQAKHVRLSGQDRKWEELSKLLQDNPEMLDSDGNRRKLILFTEHRDTLNYLTDRIRNLEGNEESVVLIHGGVKRELRRRIQEQFTQDKDVIILVATDAAGEGINLQRANLMVNYDLPWNPNRLEQRFGRIHRIGQTEVCHMWNIVANETREGDVFQRLFDKLEVEREALGGRVFDILGDVFRDRSLKDMLIEAIRYGESPEVKAKLFEQVDHALDREHLKKILESDALGSEHMTSSQVFAVKEELEKAEARRLQPHFIKSFFEEAFSRAGGQLKEREPGRFEISHVPAAIRQRDRVNSAGRPVLKKYERICFEKDKIRQRGKPMASLVCPGHPLMDATLDLMLEKYRPLLKRGSILIDSSDEGVEPHLLFIIDHSIRDAGVDQKGQPRIVSRRMQFIRVGRDGEVSQGGYAPYLDCDRASPDQLDQLKEILDEPWLKKELEGQALAHAVATLVPDHLNEVKTRRVGMVEKTTAAVQERLVKEINYWNSRAVKLDEEVSAGKQPRVQPEMARRRADELTERLQHRIKDLEAQRQVVSNTPVVVGGALVIPKGLLEARPENFEKFSDDAKARAKIEQIAMNVVIEAEQALGHETIDVSKENCGWDITSRLGTGDLRFIEVKGRAKGAKTVTVTKNEILTGLNKLDQFVLALVVIDGDQVDGPRYVFQPFSQVPDFGVTSINYDLSGLLEQAVSPSPVSEVILKATSGEQNAPT